MKKLTEKDCKMQNLTKGAEMKRRAARQIAQTITSEQLQEMFDNAKMGVKDWTVPSIVNKGLTKGFVWNIHIKYFDINKEHGMVAKINMIRDFGDFLPNKIKLKDQKKKRKFVKAKHQDPIFKQEQK